MTMILVAVIVFLAAFLQTLSGFGFALIVMPLITIVLGLRTAAPLVALAGLTLYTINLIRYRQAVNIREVLRLGAASALGIPVGIWALVNVDESVVRSLLGLILIAYAVYALARPVMPRLRSHRWVYPAGFVAGCLGGAYNTPGPPVIVYGSLRQWPKDEFRAVLQAFFLFNAVLIVTSHYLAHHLTTTVLTFYLHAVPTLVLGVLAGSRVDRRVNKGRFRTLVTVMILILGMSLVFGGCNTTTLLHGHGLPVHGEPLLRRAGPGADRHGVLCRPDLVVVGERSQGPRSGRPGHAHSTDGVDHAQD